jgi:transmembrane sensor
MTDEEFGSLCEKHLAGTCTAEEQRRFDAYLAAEQVPDELAWDEASMGAEQQVGEAIRKQLAGSVHQTKAKPRRLTSRRLWVVAASVLLLLSVGLYRWRTQQNQSAVAVVMPPVSEPADFKPGRNKALLTLADGSTISLDDARNGLLAQQGASTVQKAQAGQLVYTPSASSAGGTSEAAMNTVATPRGGQYQLVLPDGSKVWLNAASSLRFPTAFTGRERRVELTGEAYFEVAKNKQLPFKVSVEATEVTVLGTHFNVMAYADEPSLTTTLLEGAVRVSGGGQQVLLRPGQQARQQAGGTMAVATVDPQNAVAWKNGQFIFNDEPIESIMRQISRWYDVEVEYQGTMKGKEFNGTVSRFDNASQVLHMLELTGAIHFNTQGNRIIVQP